MERNPNIGAGQGTFIEVEDKRSTIVSNIDCARLVYRKLLKPETIGTGGSIFRLKALESVGGFDIRIKGAAEDLDVTRRIRESGWTLGVNPSARVYSKLPIRTTLKAFWAKYSWYGYGNHFLFHKFKDQMLLIEYFPPFALLVTFRLASLIYRSINMKKAIIWAILQSIGMMAKYVGFIRAHLDGYGHSISSQD